MSDDTVLLVRVGSRLCTLRLGDVTEVMRPQPRSPLAGVPDFVSGLAVIRGEAMPVLDMARLLEGTAVGEGGRFVTVRAGARHVALAVSEVLGVRRDLSAHQGLPPLASAAAAAVEAVGTLDRELMLVLAVARLVPEALWPVIGAESEAQP